MFFALVSLALTSGPAHACGGFFCSGGTTTTTTTTGYGTVPVVQDGERILFRMNGDGTVTTFVEVGFEQNEDVDFAWIIPIPDAIPVENVSTADAALFNALERATAPTFSFQFVQQNQNGSGGYYNYNYGGRGRGGESGCACGKSSSDDSASTAGTATNTSTGSSTTLTEDVSVVVVDEAVVGPFAIEVITATDALEFALWLEANGYDMPEAAVDPLTHYIDQGMAFLGVKLAPDVPAGPIDTLVFTCPAPAPTIPLILTSIASADDLAITAYLLGEEAYAPNNWATTEDIAPATLPDGNGGTDYMARVQAATGSFGGQAMVLEYSGLTESLALEDLLLDATIHQYPRITRYRGEISPWEMTLDPVFSPLPTLGNYSRDHTIVIQQGTGTTRRGGGAWLWFAPLTLLGIWRRRCAR